ncbi:autotransporter outer membrane beta-barrel domain-containing protein [Luteibacter aegosomaticola]|uniref:autotransporter outer membrane beta-barrel domain-containing protein n=1 Tax=Luteibacter aegosomaticola TaxID=2911538 RepID=UPI001FFA76E4|nr:autotransporter outer membrane beta-barrel domain-containing protein [Luteibacter aegosomaticola]UPG92070.1 autotransporter outer membrane beta-barrel domain-containing protein [Luteibacter aegosomaticola]
MDMSRLGHRLAGVVAIAGGFGAVDVSVARSLAEDEVAVVEGGAGPPEPWVVNDRARLFLTNGARSDYVSVDGGSLTARSAFVKSEVWGISSRQGVIDIEDSRIESPGSVGIRLEGRRTDLSSDLSSLARISGSVVRGGVAGLSIDANSSVLASSSLIESSERGGMGIVLASGSATVTDRSEVRGDASGVYIGSQPRVPDGGATKLIVDGSSVVGVNGPGIQMGKTKGTDSSSFVWLHSGSTLTSGIGVAAAVASGASLSLQVDSSRVMGDVIIDDGATAEIGLSQRASLTGNVNGDAAVTVGDAAKWSLTGDSSIRALGVSGGYVGFDPGATAGRRLMISHDVVGEGGRFDLRVETAALGGARDRGDQILVRGDVNTSNPVLIEVALSGNPIPTDSNGNHVADSNEGASLVQVGGSSAHGAFQLTGKYLTLGAYQYELKSFGPDEVDQTQNSLEDSAIKWDYRLVSREVGSGGGSAERPAVAPQIASYISAPAAVFAYADGITTSLHERLGELRDHAFEGSVGAEMFARYSSKNQRYSSGVAFKNYGYDFDESMEAWQLGGSLVGLDGDNGSLRAGWAVDRGRSSIVPRAVDGESVTRLKANGSSAWVTWRSGDGFWADWVVSRQRMSGWTDTTLSGPGVGRIRATSTGVSMGSGLPFQVGGLWTVEPHALLSTQSVAIKSLREEGGLRVRFGNRRFVTTAAGVSVFHHGRVYIPFVRLDVRRTSGGGALRAGVDGGQVAARFEMGRGGSEYSLASGLTAQITPRVQAFGEGAYRHFVGSGGFQGWSGNVGMRVTF